MKHLIIGAKGQLASDLRETFPAAMGEVESAGRDEADVSDRNKVRALLESRRPDVVISTAAYHLVDLCQERSDLAFGINAVGASILAQECARVGARLVWYSTDFVFDGESREPYHEDHRPRPLSVYGASKLAGEHGVRMAGEDNLVIRTAALIGVAGTSGKGSNFVELMIRLAKEGKSLRVVNDQVTAPTHTRDVAARTWRLVEKRARGLAHVTARGEVTWYEVTRQLLEMVACPTDLTGVTAAEYGAPAPRPRYSCLAHDTLERLGIEPMPHWRDGLISYLELKGHLPRGSGA